MASESEVCKVLALTLNGAREVPTESGYIDILTETDLIEVKAGRNWKCGIGQLIAYGYDYPNHKLVLYLFDHKGLNIKRIKDVCDSANIFLKLYSDKKERTDHVDAQRVEQLNKRITKEELEVLREYRAQKRKEQEKDGLASFLNRVFSEANTKPKR